MTKKLSGNSQKTELPLKVFLSNMGGKTKRAMLRLADLVGNVGISDSYGVSA